jgi:PAS domain S-box-containing protein
MMAAIDRDLRRRWSDEPVTPRRQPVLADPASPAPKQWTPFVIAAAVGMIALLIYFALVVFAAAGAGLAKSIDPIFQAAAALAAAASCLVLARASTGKNRLAWSLIGASALITFTVGAGTAAFYQLTTGLPVPFPSPADALYLLGEAVLIAGLLSLPSSPTTAASRSRVTIDGFVIGVSLLYISWSLGLGALYTNAHISFLSGAVGLAYPLADMVMVTVLLLVLRRAQSARYGRLSLLLVGLVAKLIADSALAVISASTGMQVNGHLVDIVWIGGYAFIALAAWWPLDPSARSLEDGPTTLWQMLLPWLGMAGVVLTSLTVSLAGRPLSPLLIYPGVALVALLMASQLLSYKDSLKFLNQSRNAETALQARTNLLNQVIAHAPLGIGRISPENRFIDANPRLGSLLHAPMKILLGASVTEFRDPQPQLAGQYEALRNGDADTLDEEGPVRRADGSTTWLHWSTTAVRRADGTLDYYLAMAEDVTARHEADEVAVENLAGLERLNTMKSDFVSMVSHEFRTALVGIQGFSEMIRDDTLDIPDIKELAGDINKDALRLNRMITGMLDLDRMEAGKILLELKPLDLNGILADSIERAKVGQETHHVFADLDVALPVVSGDSDRLIQVVSNLLSNAIKYSPDGGEVKVTSRREGEAVHVSIQDHGLGIPAEFINHMFGRYERFESNRKDKVAGTGLGLAISRQIVELHGGRIWVDSEAGKGSIFHFTIPIAAVPAVGLAAAGVR